MNLLVLSWADKVRRELRIRGLKQKDLAKVLNVKPPIVSDLLNYGKGNEKHISTINEYLNIKQ